MKKDINPRTFKFLIKLFVRPGHTSPQNRSLAQAARDLTVLELSQDYLEFNHAKAIEKALYEYPTSNKILDLGLKLHQDKSTENLKVYEVDAMTECGYYTGFVEAYCGGSEKDEETN